MIRTIPPYANGQIPKSKLKPIPGGQLWEPAANAWNDLVDHVREHEGVTAANSLRAGGPDSSYRLYGRQVYFKNLWTRKGHPEMAADPGTSNHGLGIAVDCSNALGQQMLRKYGHLFGWSNYEGARINEAWHWTYCGSKDYKRRVARKIKLTNAEKVMVDALRSERRSAERHGGWNKIDKFHKENAEKAKSWLRNHATALSKDKVRDTEYRDRKVQFLRDVALNRNGLGN
jgi:hypothetical protein